MNRRGFLVLVGATPVAASLPLVAPKAVAAPVIIGELTEKTAGNTVVNLTGENFSRDQVKRIIELMSESWDGGRIVVE